MKSLLLVLVVSLGLSGCAGAFGDAADYFTGPVSGVGLKPATSIASGGTERLAAVVVPAKTANKRVRWSSSDEVVATVDENGLVSAVAVVGYGETKTATITATTEEGGYTADCVVTVTEKPVPVTGIALNRIKSTLVVNDPGIDQLVATITPADATNQTITWTSDAPAIVTVDSSGLVSAKQAGTGTITAASGNGITATCKYTVLSTPVAATGIRLNKTASVIAAGKTETFFPVLSPWDVTNQNVSWTTSNSAIATVNSLGVVSGIAASAVPVIITAKTTDGTNLAASVSVRVAATVVPVTGVSVSPPVLLLGAGKQTQIMAAVQPSEATDQTVLWTSDNPCALVDSAGVVTGISAGTATVRASAGNGGFSAVCYVVVTSAPTYSVTYNANFPAGVSLASGSAPIDSMQYLAGQSVAVKANDSGLFANGYVFNGWRNSEGVIFNPGQTFAMGMADTILYAVWSRAYRVTYNANLPAGAEILAGSVPVDDTNYLAGNPVRVLTNVNKLFLHDYRLVSWNGTSSTTGTMYPFGSSFFMETADLELFGVWAAKIWTAVGNTGSGTGKTASMDMALAPDGTPYVAYMDSANENKAVVMKLQGGNWVNVGNTHFSAGAARNMTIAIAPDGTPYVAYRDDTDKSDITGDNATVMKFNGTSWETVGNQGFSAGVVQYTDIAIAPDGAVFVAYNDKIPNDSSYPDGAAAMMKFTGSDWESVGSRQISSGYARTINIAIASDGTPFVVYQNGSGGKASVKKFDGTDWVSVGGDSVSEKKADYTRIAIDLSDTLYVAYLENSLFKGRKFNGTEWVDLGDVGMGGSYLDLAIDPFGVPYVAFTSDQIPKVMRYNGSGIGWKDLGSSATAGYYDTNIIIDSQGTPYLGYRTFSNATVQRYE